jgi:peptide chain release factor 1
MLSCVVGGSFDVELLERSSGFICFLVKGKCAGLIFAHESGGHRFQRVSPTEKRGRVHTSTITVAVLPCETNSSAARLSEKDLEWSVCRSGGSGGQHVNKTNTAVQLKHIPTGMMVRVESRSQYQNKQLALDILYAKLNANKKIAEKSSRDLMRRGLVGSGQRGDKIRTIAIQHDSVHDHLTNKRCSYKRYARGDFDWLLD